MASLWYCVALLPSLFSPDWLFVPAEAYPLRDSDMTLSNVPTWVKRGYTEADTEEFVCSPYAFKKKRTVSRPLTHMMSAIPFWLMATSACIWPHAFIQASAA